MTKGAPRIFALPAGADFAAHFLQGLKQRYLNRARPEDFARLEVIVNTERLKGLLVQNFSAEGRGFIPRIKVLSNLINDPEWVLPACINARSDNFFSFFELVRGLSKADGKIVPKGSVVALSQSLGELMEEIESEYVDFSTISALEVEEFSEHWQRNLEFLRLIHEVREADKNEPLACKTRYGLLRAVIEAKIAEWQIRPPSHPIIIAGSTGSRAPSARLMHAVAHLENGAVVLPALDYDYAWPCPDASGAKPDKYILPHDHAQSRLARFIYQNGKTPADIERWAPFKPLHAGRSGLISLALCPAPVTNKWREDGPKLGDMRALTKGLSLICARDEQTEVGAIALCLREAVEAGKTASVITPSRVLGRKIAAALKRWGIVADESAGVALNQTPTGRFIIALAERVQKGAPLPLFDALVFLKNPLLAGADKKGRVAHLKNLRGFEFWARREGKKHLPFAEALHQWAEMRDDNPVKGWAHWCVSVLEKLSGEDFSTQLSALVARAQKAFSGDLSGVENALESAPSDSIWQGREGRLVKQNLESLSANAPAQMQVSSFEFMDILTHSLSRSFSRTLIPTHPSIAIWGSLEARAQRSQLTIIAGLNEDIWPGKERPDYWLNRAMRARAGLVSPDSYIGLMAHDFQSAISDGDVVLSRALRAGDGESVASRWVLRLENLLRGLSAQNGEEALASMQKRGDKWIGLAENLARPTAPVPRAPRPAPCPAKAARPRAYSPTSIEQLIRDPYHIYTKYILKLSPLEEIYAPLDGRQKGIFFHQALQNFGQSLRACKTATPSPEFLRTAFEGAINEMLAHDEIDAFTRMLWREEIAQWQSWFLECEAGRQKNAHIEGVELKARDRFDSLDITITASADRVDIDAQNRARIYDYKTGKIPTKNQVEYFSKQLLIEAALLERGAFEGVGKHRVALVEYIELGKKPHRLTLEAGHELFEQTDKIWSDTEKLLRAYQCEDMGFSARRALQNINTPSDYDQLSRFGEWDITQEPQIIKLGSNHG